MVQLHSSTDMAIAWKNSCYIVSEKSDFHIFVNLLIVVNFLIYAYVDIVFSWWDNATDVYNAIADTILTYAKSKTI